MTQFILLFWLIIGLTAAVYNNKVAERNGQHQDRIDGADYLIAAALGPITAIIVLYANNVNK